MGYSRGHTAKGWTKAERQSAREEVEDGRSSMCGNSFHPVVVAWLNSQLLFFLGLAAAPLSPQQCVGTTGYYTYSAIGDTINRNN